MNAVLEIIRAGIQTTVQDSGRIGFAQWGVPQGGVADGLAFQIANLLLRNSENAAVLEITMGGFQARFLCNATFALAGADGEATLDGKRLLPNSRHIAAAGQELVISHPQRGVRTYLALEGGIDVPQCLGSRATLLSSHIGGVQGRALRRGDILYSQSRAALSALSIAPPRWRSTLRMMQGPQAKYLLAEQQGVPMRWQIAVDSNRMGLKLNGDKLGLQIPIEINSQAVFAGTIQLPPNGLPIILMADAQTSGGYPIIAQVIQADCWLLGQLRAGDWIDVQWVEHATAIAVLQQQRHWLAEMKRIVDVF